MAKCVYCACTANIEPGKGYCGECGHDEVAHVVAAAPGGSQLGLKLLIVAGAILAAYFFLNSRQDSASGIPSSAGGPSAGSPNGAGTAPSPATVYTLPPPAVQPNGQVTPAAPPLGSWQSNPGSANQGTPNPALPDSATPNPGTANPNR